MGFGLPLHGKDLQHFFFFLKIGHQGTYKTQYQEALSGRRVCSERATEDHLCPLQRYEDQRHGGLSASILRVNLSSHSHCEWVHRLVQS